MNGTRNISEFRLLLVCGFENTSFLPNPKIKYLRLNYPQQRLHVYIPGIIMSPFIINSRICLSNMRTI